MSASGTGAAASAAAGAWAASESALAALEAHPHTGGAPQHPDAPLDIPTDLFNSDTNRLSFCVAIFLSLYFVT